MNIRRRSISGGIGRYGLENTNYTDTYAPADDKRRAHLNCIRYLLGLFPYQDVMPEPVMLKPRRPADDHYLRPPRDAHLVVPDHYASVS